jgi:hypothetical protein
MRGDFPTVKIGRPSGAQGDWVMTLVCGLLMGGITIYLLFPTTWSEFLMLVPVVLIIGAVLGSNFLRYTYGEIGPAGLLYRRPWGWRTAPWAEIASVELDPEVPDAIRIKLRQGYRWTRTLRFQNVLNSSETTFATSDLIQQCKALCVQER